jgi:hypothetical protein
MAEDGETVFCSGCSLRTGEDPDAFPHGPCPECGSGARYIRYLGSDARMMVRSTVKRRPGQKKTPVESKQGDELSVARGRWVRVHRIIDRRRDLYYEKIHDPETRKILHEVEEPLTQHRGHGSARPHQG